MTTKEEVLERVDTEIERALFDARNQRDVWRDADLAIIARRAALRAAAEMGWRMVPVEASDEHIARADPPEHEWKHHAPFFKMHRDDDHKGIYAALVAAAPSLTEE